MNSTQIDRGELSSCDNGKRARDGQRRARAPSLTRFAGGVFGYDGGVWADEKEAPRNSGTG